ncbi:MAG: hypothetical protein JWM58_4529 [Rhizobium sp.]|nr:hypothetical protein [Rhizobium sp.]
MSSKTDEHPEQDPAEGSRETIDRELARQTPEGKNTDKARKPSKGRVTRNGQQDHRPM